MPSATVVPATAPGRRLGLYPANAFELSTGHVAARGPLPSRTSRQALWYFANEVIAQPTGAFPAAGWAARVRLTDDLRAWACTLKPGDPLTAPPLVWLGAPLLTAGARLHPDGTALLLADGVEAPLRLAPQIPLNRAYFDASSARFFADRSVRVRGDWREGALLARTFWPEDFRLDLARPQTSAPTPPGAEADALRQLVRGDPHGGARSPFAAKVLWQRSSPGRSPAAGSSVLGFILNGAQGDDDESLGGHFAVVTGTTTDDGAIGDWLVNNFYSLDIESEKGILAAPVPLDNYLGDLNSGQGWYRPSYLLVAVLSDDRTARRVQGALNRAYLQFYRHQLVYAHATMNCAGISIDVLRTLGWAVPAVGSEAPLLGALGFPWFLASEHSLRLAHLACNYLIEDRTRLLPAVAFESAGASLWRLAAGFDSAEGQGELARELAADVDTIAFLRLPQFPSSRAFGDAPVISTREYRQRMPADPAARQIVPVPSRPFPAELRDPDLLPPPREPSTWIARGWLVLLFAVLAGLATALVAAPLLR